MTDRPKNVPTFTSTTITTATTYHFRVTDQPGRGGWALATVNDATGELAIQSDWGSWSNRWGTSPQSLGVPTLTHFIGERGGAHYLADKLTSLEERSFLDADATVAEMRKRLCARRLEQGRAGCRDRRYEPTERYGRDDGKIELSREVARSAYEALSDLSDLDGKPELFIERFYRCYGANWISEEIWHDDVMQYRPGHPYLVLLHGILPALREACAAQVKTRAPAAAEVSA